MKAFDANNGHLYVLSSIKVEPGMDFEDLKRQLNDNTIPFVESDSYNLFQFINLNNIRFDNKTFKLELYFDKKRLKTISFDFVCDKGYEISFEQWVAEMLDNKSAFAWGRMKVDDHPKYNVPLINLSYDLP